MKFIELTKACTTRPNNPAKIRKTMCIPMLYTNAGKVSTTTNIHTCREVIISDYARLLEFYKQSPPNKHYKLDDTFSRAILMGLTEKDMDPLNIRTSINAVNAIENTLGWELTRVEGVKQPKTPLAHNERPCSLCFTGSSKWFRSSHTMSLWLLLIRLPFDNKALRVSQDMDDIWEAVKSSRLITSVGGAPTVAKDKVSLKKAHKVIIPLLSKLDKYFPPDVSAVDRFDRSVVYQAGQGQDNFYAPSVASDGIFMFSKKASKHPGCKAFWKEHADL